MLVWEKMRRELGLGERLDRDRAEERTRGWAGCAHPASLAVRGRSAMAGGRGSGCPQAAFALAVVPHPGTQAPEMARGRWPRHKLRDGFQIVVSYGYQFRGAARPWRPVGIWNHKISVSRIRRPGFEFLAVKHWANHVISLKSVHWRPGPGSALTHSLSPLPSTPPPASARLQFPPKKTSCSVPPQACSPVNFPEYTSGPVVLSNPPVPIAHRSN